MFKQCMQLDNGPDVAEPPQLCPVIFDLDGTLIDSSLGILAGFRKAFATLNITPTRPITDKVIGPPLAETLALLSGSYESAELTLLENAFKAYYDTEGYRLTKAITGIETLLRQLSARKIPMLIATNKRAVATRRIIELLGWTDIFAGIYSLDNVNPAPLNKNRLLSHILSHHRLHSSSTLYVGDRYEDGKAAEYNNMPFALALWGHPNEVRERIPDKWLRLDKPEDLLGYLHNLG